MRIIQLLLVFIGVVLLVTSRKDNYNAKRQLYLGIIVLCIGIITLVVNFIV